MIGSREHDGCSNPGRAQSQINAALLPCPHCGGVAGVDVKGFIPQYVFIRCSRGCCQTREFATASVAYKLSGSFGNSVHRQKVRLAVRAMKIWNKRI